MLDDPFTLTLRPYPPPEARYIGRLASLYRRIRRSAEKECSTLESELALVGAYLELQGERLGEKLRYELRAFPLARSLSLPSLAIYPLVENAVRHGVEPAGGGQIEVEVTPESAGGYRLRVCNTGAPLRYPLLYKSGLARMLKRLEDRYGSRHGFHLGRTPDGATVAGFRLPL